MSEHDPTWLAQLAAIKSHAEGDAAPIAAVLQSECTLLPEVRQYLAQVLLPRPRSKSTGRPPDPRRDLRDLAVREAYYKLVDSGVKPAQAKAELAGRMIVGSLLSPSSIESIVGNKRRDIAVRPARPRPASK